ncbi:hypothetical protein QE152_g39951 [Popillia japonica]|uniref:Uncharacterized protein n=1 Tax=Popillia japonica TaxID=7064 RepID=A0AAW1HSQ9_POPJA
MKSSRSVLRSHDDGKAILQTDKVLQTSVINKEINKENINESIEKTSANDESDSDNTATVNTLPRKRKKENLCEKRHREKMARLDTFNDLFKKMVDKM